MQRYTCVCVFVYPLVHVLLYVNKRACLNECTCVLYVCSRWCVQNVQMYWHAHSTCVRASACLCIQILVGCSELCGKLWRKKEQPVESRQGGERPPAAGDREGEGSDEKRGKGQKTPEVLLPVS